MTPLSLLAALAVATVSIVGAAALKSDSHCQSVWCLLAIYDPDASTTNYTLTVSSGGRQIGWYGIGTGTQMSGSNIMVGWVNADSSVTMSHRSTTGHNMPNEAAAQSLSGYIADSVKSKSNSSSTIFQWSLATSLAPSNKESHIWAYNTRKTPGTASSSSIIQHENYGTLTLDMTKAYDPTDSSNSTKPTPGLGRDSSGSGGASRSDNLIIAHMVFMVIGWFVFAAAGALIARWGRTFFTWFPVHRVIQLTALLFVLVGFGIILGQVGTTSGTHFDSDHARLGLFMVCAMIVQCLWGQMGHVVRRKRGTRLQNYPHIVFGLLLFGIAAWTATEGFNLWQQRGRHHADIGKKVIWTWSSVLGVAYIAGFLLLPKELRQNRAGHPQVQDSKSDLELVKSRQNHQETFRY